LSLKNDLREVLPPEIVPKIPSGFQIIGDVAVLSPPAALHDYRARVASAVLSRHRNIQTVLNRKPISHGRLRVADYEILAGDHTMTTCREYGILLQAGRSAVLLYKQAGI